MEAHITHFIGAYLIVRGLSFIFGGYPNEAKIFDDLSEGRFRLSGSFLVYLLLFLLLNIAGSIVQHKYDPELLN
jgi:hypothetical protein